MVKFFQKIIGVKINYKHILTMVKDAVYIHELEGMACILKLDLDNHFGRVILSPNISRGQPLIFYSNTADTGVLEVYDIDKNKALRTITAHTSSILKIACDLEGFVVATTSSHGDSIRLWSAVTGLKLATFKLQPYVEL